MDPQQIGIIIALIILILLSACFSSSETAYSHVNGIRLKNMAKEGNKKAEVAYQVYRNLTAAITTILIGNNIVNILATSLATLLFSQLFGELGVAIATAVMTVLILVFGEITPKVIAQSKPEAICMFMARPMLILMAVFKPVSSIAVSAQSKWEDGEDIKKVTATEDELLEIVSTIEQEGVLVQDERELIESVIEFDDTSIKDVMVPRDEVIWIYDNASYTTLKKIVRENKLSRFPVISHETLKVVGILRIRDILDCLLSDRKVNITKMMSAPIFVSQRKKLPQILEEIQKSRVHMAIVTESSKIDNFVGVVTLEDILEELVGEIYDEYDLLPDHVVEFGHHTFEVEGKVNLAHFFDEYLDDYELPQTAARSVAQWVKELAGGKVRKGKEIEYENYEIKVLATKEGMATKIELRALTPVEDDEE
ncbi:putative hemolysin [Breznakia sp. PF5-3]|uniref:hemolysin family protein n=1 Tax=unclassified Breznakia TaxID=2623764 RepID=UPI0024071817|nr:MULTISPECIES: hemolysin family protein [unclassified Breznakia]MDL2276412.1 hemolysin family protein [Breznakia sp. OttesenSCG-928-G09]MDF9823798.1 putative hemolysin [Breznakia sp. PM6-1]MDF9834636.1 putative hemolysin [Breznakia sp. PF5-3]MDF9836747.1 putative hemolysin [Breznakia sp. PFB2-8]MDF9858804.1 putative hemolysin [Breznakia sp. PH5-24]